MFKSIVQKFIVSFLLLFLFFSAQIIPKAIPQALAQEITPYKIDKKNSSVGFTACCHAFISNVNGVFKKYEAQVSVDKDQKIQSVSAEIQADSVDTDSRRRDKHLRKDDFFDVKNHPKITFESSKIEYLGANTNGTNGQGGEILATGNLTIKAITKEIELKGKVLASSKDKIVLEATAIINKNDFGISYSKMKDVVTLIIKITLKP